MTTERRICVRGIIFKDGKLFAQRLKSKKTSKVNKFWSTPGGGLDPGEGLQAGLHREMIEETGITPQIGNLLLTQQFMDDGVEQLEFFYHIENADDYETINLAETTHGELEIEHFGFIDPKTESILPQPLQTMDIERYTTSNQPVVALDFLTEK